MNNPDCVIFGLKQIAIVRRNMFISSFGQMPYNSTPRGLWL